MPGSLTIDDERLRRRLEEEGGLGLGLNPLQGQQGGFGPQKAGGYTESGILVSVVEDAKKTDVFSAAARSQGTEGGGAASVGVNVNDTGGGTGIQADTVPNQPMNGVVPVDGGQSGLQTGPHALGGATRNDPHSSQGGPTDDKGGQKYQFSQEGNLTSIAYSGNGEGTTPLSGEALDGLNSRLGVPTNTGEATLTATDPTETGGADGTDGTDGADGAGGTDGADGTNGTDETDGNVNGSGNEDDKNDSANGNVDDGNKPVETAEDEAKRLAEEQLQQQLKNEQDRHQEEERARRLAA